MIFTRRTLLAAASACALLAQPLAASAQDLPRNVRLVIGSTSTGGDTYQAASIVAEALAEKLEVNIKVDAVGPTEAFKAVGRDRRGTTLMIHHDQSYLGYLYGQRGYEDIFETYAIGPTLAVNPGNAYLVAKNSPYQTMDDILAAAESGERVRVAIQPGGVSEIGFSAMKNATNLKAPGSAENLVPVNTGSQSDKDGALFDGLADVINGSIQSNEQYTQLPEDDQKAMRFVWITARPETLQQAPEAGMGALSREDMLRFAAPDVSIPLDQGGDDFTFDKVFFLIYNKEMDPAIAQTIDTALSEIYAEGKVQERLTAGFFIPDYRPAADALAHLREKNDAYAEMIQNIAPKSN